MIINTISEAKASLSELIDQASKGEEIILCRAGKPVAVLRAYRKADRPREPGALRGKVRIAPDFDELPGDLAEALGSKPT
jgi:prevent-host-death family protein